MATKKKPARKKKKRAAKGPTLTLNAERLVPGTIELVPVDGLKPHPKNPRKGNKGIIRESVEANDFYGIVIGQRSSGRIIAGWHRVLAAREEKVPKLPVEWLDVDDEKAERIMLVDNRAGDKAGYDDDKLVAVLKGLDSPSLGTGYDDRALLKLLGTGDVEEPATPDPPKKPITKLGDVWTLGDHRLICGDCTKSTIWTRLMGKKTAQLLATDPPYGVAYGVETGEGSKFGAMDNDENDGPRLQAFLESAFEALTPHLADNAAWYLWHAQMTQGFFAAAAAAAAAVIIHRQIIWVKPSLILGHGDYHWRHELCFYGWRKGHRAPWYGDRTQTTVWEIGRENDHIHPTQKPVELFARPLRFNTQRGELCIEPFAGSGSALIAAEQLSRRCFGVELSPAYCDVIVERWQNFTGKKAKRAARSKA